MTPRRSMKNELPESHPEPVLAKFMGLTVTPYRLEYEVSGLELRETRITPLSAVTGVHILHQLPMRWISVSGGVLLALAIVSLITFFVLSFACCTLWWVALISLVCWLAGAIMKRVGRKQIEKSHYTLEIYTRDKEPFFKVVLGALDEQTATRFRGFIDLMIQIQARGGDVSFREENK